MQKIGIYLLIVLPLFANAQWQPTPKVIQRLLNHSGTIPSIYCNNKDLLPKWIVPEKLIKEKHYLVKTSNGLFAGIEGTGQLYQLTDSAELLTARRIDTTYFTGNSFYPITFSIGPTLYSFGGYGYWKDNGVLRYYSPLTREWDAIKTDRELPAINTQNFWIDTSRRQFYLECPRMFNEGPDDSAVKKKMSRTLWKLDIKSGHWEDMGILNRTGDKNAFHASWGNIHFFTIDQFYLYDYVHQKEYAAKKEFSYKFRKYYANEETQVHYMIDSTIYFGNLEFDSFDSIPVSRADFSLAGTALCAQEGLLDFSKERTTGIIISIVLTGTGVFFLMRRKKFIKRPEPKSEDRLSTKNKNGTKGTLNEKRMFKLFSPEETRLLYKLYVNANRGMNCTPAEIIRWMNWDEGPMDAARNPIYQHIHLINQKWSVLNKSEKPLIIVYRLPGEQKNESFGVAKQWLSELKGLEAFQ